MNGTYLALATRIHEALVELENVINRAQMHLDKSRIQQDDSHLDGAALNLHGFYTGVEQVFEDIARTIDGGIPAGPNWHKELLLQMSGELTPLRPPVIQTSTRRCLDEYRGFRHVVRNVYTFNLRPQRIEELVQELHTCFHAVQTDMAHFSAFLNEAGN